MAINRNRYDPAKGSEYGGVPGPIQPPPHELTSSEMLMMLYQTDPAAGYIDGQNPTETQEIPPVESP